MSELGQFNGISIFDIKDCSENNPLQISSKNPCLIKIMNANDIKLPNASHWVNFISEKNDSTYSEIRRTFIELDKDYKYKENDNGIYERITSENDPFDFQVRYIFKDNRFLAMPVTEDYETVLGTTTSSPNSIIIPMPDTTNPNIIIWNDIIYFYISSEYINKWNKKSLKITMKRYSNFSNLDTQTYIKREIDNDTETLGVYYAYININITTPNVYFTKYLDSNIVYKDEYMNNDDINTNFKNIDDINGMCTNCGYTDELGDECPMCHCKEIRRLRMPRNSSKPRDDEGKELKDYNHNYNHKKITIKYPVTTIRWNYDNPPDKTKKLKYYQFSLYNEDNVRVDGTDKIYVNTTKEEVDKLSFVTNGLDDDSQYTLCLSCGFQSGEIITAENLIVKTDYVINRIYPNLNITPNIEFAENVVSVQLTTLTGNAGIYESDQSINDVSEWYIDSEKIDLRNNRYVQFEEKYNYLTDNYTFRLWLNDLSDEKVLKASTDKINLTVYYDSVNKRFYALKEYHDLTYRYVSNNIDGEITSDTQIYLTIGCFNNRIGLYAKIIE